MIIGLCGYSKVGKDSLCTELQNYDRFAFADVLKQEVTTMLKQVGIEADLWGENKEEWRDMLVFWGRKRRSLDRDYWIKQMYVRLAPMEKKRVCVTDIRYPNEVRWVQKHHGLVLGIDRPGYGPANEEEAISIREIRIQHPEIQWLMNDGYIQDLAVLARKIIQSYNVDRYSGKTMV